MLQVKADKPSNDAGTGKAPEAGDTLEGLSGARLNTAIAVRLMKWIPTCGNYWMGNRPGGGKWNCSIHEADSWAYEYKGGLLNPIDGKEYCGKSRYQWNPSESIADAMEVVEKLRGDGWSFACTLYEGKLPYASFCKRTAASSRNAEASTLPEAICRAALAAIEQEKEEQNQDSSRVVEE